MRQSTERRVSGLLGLGLVLGGCGFSVKSNDQSGQHQSCKSFRSTFSDYNTMVAEYAKINSSIPDLVDQIYTAALHGQRDTVLQLSFELRRANTQIQQESIEVSDIQAALDSYGSLCTGKKEKP
jgi:hypothetical protein